MHAQQMHRHPRTSSEDAHPEARRREETRQGPSRALVAAIEAAYDCAQASTACADACVAEADPLLAQCIRLNLDCADVCATAGAVATRRVGSNDTVVMGLLMLCEALCRECERHAGHMEHCRICAEVCRRCEAACREARASLLPEPVQ